MTDPYPGFRKPEAKAVAQQAFAALEEGDAERAEAIARNGVAAATDDPAWARFTLGWVLQTTGRLPEAEAEYRLAIALDPNYASAYHNLGNILQGSDSPKVAEAAFRRTLELDPDHSHALDGLGRSLRSQAALTEAIEAFRRHLAKAPEDRDRHLELAFTLLLAGRFAEAWPHYERRKPPCPEAVAPERQWTGDALDGRSLLVFAEQGLGDTIQFLRYAIETGSGDGRVALVAQPALAALCRSTPALDAVYGYDDPLPSFDCHARLMSLPALFGTMPDRVPADVPYLMPEPRRVAAWRERLDDGLIERSSLKVGLAWQGKPGRRLDRGRSIPLRALFPLAQVPGVRLISLQKHHGRDQIADMPDGGRFLEDYSDEMDEGPDAFLDTAAIMANLDLVISSDTAIPHLAGALGRPVWLLLKKIPEWRWLIGRSDSPWYPTMRLFRQSRDGNWGNVVDDVVEALSQLSSSGGLSRR